MSLSLSLSGQGIGPSSAPVNVVAPSFTGTLTAGQTLTYVAGTWSGSPSLTHTWLSDGLVVGTGATLDTTGMGGTCIAIGEFASNALGSATEFSEEEYLFTNEAARAIVARISVEPEDYWKVAYDGAFSVSGFATALAKLDQFAMFSGPSKQAALLDWCAVRSITENGTMTHTPLQGFHTNGTAFLQSGVNHNAASHLTQNSASNLAYVFTDGGSISDHKYYVGLAGSTVRFRISGYASAQVAAFLNASSEMAQANATRTGLFVGVRTASNAIETRLNGSSVKTATTASAALIAAEVLYFKNNTTLAATQVILSAAGFGAAITSTDDTAIKTAVETFATLATPRNFGVVFAGQSLAALLSSDNPSTLSSGYGSGDGTAGSNAMQRVLIPELQAYLDAQYTDGRPNVLTVLNNAVSDTRLVGPVVGKDTWWDPTLNAGAGGAGAYAITDRAHVVTMKANLPAGQTFDGGFVRLWAQGEGDAAVGISQADYVNSLCGSGYVTGLIKYFRDGDGATTKVIISPLGRNSGVTNAAIKAIRDAETEAVANVASTSMAIENCDLVRRANNDWHPKSFGEDILGFDRLAHFHARTLAFALGCSSVTYKGPEVASVTAVLSTTTTVTLTYPSGCGGTDFTPTTGIEGFAVYDDGVSKAISAAIRTSATTILLTHAAVVGTRTVQYLPGQGSLNRANMLRDNFSTPMPLRMSALLTA